MSRHKESGVLHVQWHKKALLQKSIEAHAGGDLDDSAEHVHPNAIDPFGPGVVLQGQLAQLRAHVLEIFIPVQDIGFAIKLVHG